MKKFNFKETYLLEGFFDDLEDDLDDSDYVVNNITKLTKLKNQIYIKSLDDSISISYVNDFDNCEDIKYYKIIPNELIAISDINFSQIKFL